MIVYEHESEMHFQSKYLYVLSAIHIGAIRQNIPSMQLNTVIHTDPASSERHHTDTTRHSSKECLVGACRNQFD
jgi:hypothetical protein